MLSENIKSARKARGMTQEELAVHLNVVRQTISKWEKGLSVPDADLLIRLSETLEVPVSKLLGANMDFKQEDTDATENRLSRINQQLAGKTRYARRFVKTLFAVISSFFAYLIGAVIETEQSVHLPEFGIVLAVLTMGGILTFYVVEK